MEVFSTSLALHVHRDPRNASKITFEHAALKHIYGLFPFRDQGSSDFPLSHCFCCQSHWSLVSAFQKPLAESVGAHKVQSAFRRCWAALYLGCVCNFSWRSVSVGRCFIGGGRGHQPGCDHRQPDQLPALHHQSDEQECCWCHRPG